MVETSVAIRLRGLTRSFGDVVAVNGVDLDVIDGEFLTLLGPSGSGKTTVLRMIAGFERPDAGTIELAGVDVTRTPPYAISSRMGDTCTDIGSNTMPSSAQATAATARKSSARRSGAGSP